MLETEMVLLTSAQLRHREAVYFGHQFVRFCGPPQDSYFHMNCYFDAFLFSLVSVEEMVGKEERTRLHDGPTFRFIKALRNVTTHHSVLAGSARDAKFVRPFARHLFNQLGGAQTATGNLAVDFTRMREIFAEIEAKRPRDKPTLDAARSYLSELEARPQPVYLAGVMHEALAEVQAVIG